MKNFQQKEGWRRISESWPFLIILFVVIVLFAWGLFNLFLKMRETEKNKNIAHQKVLDLEARKEKLSVDIEEINTEMGKERVFRENFGLAKEGENLVVIVDEKTKKEDIVKKESRLFIFLQDLFK